MKQFFRFIVFAISLSCLLNQLGFASDFSNFFGNPHSSGRSVPQYQPRYVPPPPVITTATLQPPPQRQYPSSSSSSSSYRSSYTPRSSGFYLQSMAGFYSPEEIEEHRERRRQLRSEEEESIRIFREQQEANTQAFLRQQTEKKAEEARRRKEEWERAKEKKRREQERKRALEKEISERNQETARNNVETWAVARDIWTEHDRINSLKNRFEDLTNLNQSLADLSKEASSLKDELSQIMKDELSQILGELKVQETHASEATSKTQEQNLSESKSNTEERQKALDALNSSKTLKELTDSTSTAATTTLSAETKPKSEAAGQDAKGTGEQEKDISNRDKGDAIEESIVADIAVAAVGGVVKGGLKAAEMGIRALTGAEIGTLGKAVCFPEETPILLEDGTSVPIGPLQTSTLVKTINLTLGGLSTRCQPIVHKFEDEVDHLFHISYNGNSIRATSNHPFYVLDKGMVPAHSLNKEKDLLLNENLEAVKIDHICKQFGKFKVYNIELKDDHNYFAGNGKGFVCVGNCTRVAQQIGQTTAKAEARAVTSGAARTAESAASSVTKRSTDFVVGPKGTVYPVPSGAKGPVPVVNRAGNQTGTAFTGGSGGTNGKISDIRIMNPTPARGNAPAYPTGYIKYTNSAAQGKQGVNPISGKTGSHADTHFPVE